MDLWIVDYKLARRCDPSMQRAGKVICSMCRVSPPKVVAGRMRCCVVVDHRLSLFPFPFSQHQQAMYVLLNTKLYRKSLDTSRRSVLLMPGDFHVYRYGDDRDLLHYLSTLQPPANIP